MTQKANNKRFFLFLFFFLLRVVAPFGVSFSIREVEGAFVNTPERNNVATKRDEDEDDDDTEGGVVERILIARDAERCHVTRRVTRTYRASKE